MDFPTRTLTYALKDIPYGAKAILLHFDDDLIGSLSEHTKTTDISPFFKSCMMPLFSEIPLKNSPKDSV